MREIAGKLAKAQREPERDPPKGGRQTSTLPANFKPKTHANNVVYLPGKHPVISALELAGKHLSNEELAAMGCCGGEASKRRKEVTELPEQYRQGHCIMVGLKRWQKALARPCPQWKENPSGPTRWGISLGSVPCDCPGSLFSCLSEDDG